MSLKLDDFISETIQGIYRGTKKASVEIEKESGKDFVVGYRNDEISSVIEGRVGSSRKQDDRIRFDLLISYNEKENTGVSGSGNVKGSAIVVLKASLDGKMSKTKETENASFNRVTFTVPYLPAFKT